MADEEKKAGLTAEEENKTDLTAEEMEEVDGGKGAINIPSKPIAEIASSIACGGHEWVKTGRETEVPFLVFWSKHQKEYVCTKCGKRKWVRED